MTDAESAPTRSDYRVDPVTSTVRLPGIEDTPIGQETMFSDLEAGAESALLTARFVVPPFSVLDSRAGYWQSRKAQWLALGIQSELGRGLSEGANHNDGPGSFMGGRRRQFSGALPVTGMAGQVNIANYRRQADQRSNLKGSGRPEWMTGAHSGNENMAAGTSIFDPVLCEIAYRWFSPPGGSVLDPFAGGSVRGIVAALLGHRYTGIDLSAQQVEANRLQASAILENGDYPYPTWISGDSANMGRLLANEGKADLIFSCPPYYDLEVYSHDPGELSAMSSYEEFLRAYRFIIGLAAQRLKPERFVVWVVGEIRSKDGWQRGLVADTILAFREAGLHLYNEAVLVTPVGTLQLRVPRQFIGGRTLGRSHQSVLVFWNGAKRPAWRPLDAA